MYAIRSYYARRRLAGVLGDALGKHAQLAGMADVLLVVDRLGVEIGEDGEQQNDRITSYNVCYTKLLRPGLFQICENLPDMIVETMNCLFV